MLFDVKWAFGKMWKQSFQIINQWVTVIVTDQKNSLPLAAAKAWFFPISFWLYEFFHQCNKSLWTHAVIVYVCSTKYIIPLLTFFLVCNKCFLWRIPPKASANHWPNFLSVWIISFSSKYKHFLHSFFLYPCSHIHC